MVSGAKLLDKVHKTTHQHGPAQAISTNLDLPLEVRLMIWEAMPEEVTSTLQPPTALKTFKFMKLVDEKVETVVT